MKRLLLSGGSGMVGTLLRNAFADLGWEVATLTRANSGKGKIHWDPKKGELEARKIEGLDYVVHLAGESIASGRWTRARKKLILESRKNGTQLLSETLASLENKPRALVSASGSNYYADNEGGSPWDESAPAGDRFLSSVCVEWEKATSVAENAGIRVVHARLGAVLTPTGGLLKKMLPSISRGYGGIIGTGHQRISWIHPDDLVRAILYIIQHHELRGPVNVCSPRAATNESLSLGIARLTGKQLFLPIPAKAIWWLFGQLGEELLLSDNAATPLKLLKAGMQWEFENIDDALSDLLA